jgi:hypothetical protein
MTDASGSSIAEVLLKKLVNLPPIARGRKILRLAVDFDVSGPPGTPVRAWCGDDEGLLSDTGHKGSAFIVTGACDPSQYQYSIHLLDQIMGGQTV